MAESVGRFTAYFSFFPRGIIEYAYTPLSLHESNINWMYVEEFRNPILKIEHRPGETINIFFFSLRTTFLFDLVTTFSYSSHGMPHKRS